MNWGLSKRSDRLAAVLFVAALCAAIVRRETLPRPSAAVAYHRAVREAASAVSFAGSDWTGIDIPIPQTSLDALKPNVAISRRYTQNGTGQSVDLLLIQSPDIRDLTPHYPPVCYPGQGLKLISYEPVNLVWPDRTIVAMRYTFQWHDFRRGEPTVVDNFMVLPTGQTQPDTAGMERRIGTDHRYFGGAQVQVVYRSVLTPEERSKVTEAILTPYLPLLTAIESGPAVR